MEIEIKEKHLYLKQFSPTSLNLSEVSTGKVRSLNWNIKPTGVRISYKDALKCTNVRIHQAVKERLREHESFSH